MKQKAGRKQRDWLANIQEGKMKDIARLFFLSFITKSQATKILYVNRIKNREELHKKKLLSSVGYVAPEITKRINEWQERGFLEVSNRKVQYHKKEIQNKKEVLIKEGKPTYAFLLNLNPLFLYCKEKYDIDFKPEEKEFLNGIIGLFRSEQVRKLIFFEYPEDDIINSTLKFYVKHYIMPYGYLARLELNPINKEIKEEFERAKQKAEEVNKNKWILSYTKKQQKDSKEIYKSYGFNEKEAEKMAEQMKEIHKESNKSIKKTKYDYIDILSYKDISTDNFTHYISELKKNPELVLSVDKKIMKALGV
jgi:hypothetical protein